MSYRNPDVAATSSGAARLSALEWLLCAVVGLGFVFDAFEILVMPITVRPALIGLGVAAGTRTFNRWVGVLLYIPAVAGGLFGLFGGQLIDAFGRRRALVWSLLLYAFSTLAAATASSPEGLLIWRCFTLIGVALEFVAALTWLAELFPVARQRELVLGYSQIAYGAGSFIVTATYYLAVTYATQIPSLVGHHDPWRYALAVGTLPSIPLMLVRSRLPESPVWDAQRRRGALQRPHLGAIFRPGLRRASVSAVLVTACVYASAYGVLQQTPRLVPGLPDVRVLSPRAQEQIVSVVHLCGSLGEVSGRLLFAIVVVMFVRQRALLRTFLVPALVVVPVVFACASTSGVAALKVGSFIATLLVTAQFSFIGNYLPRLFPTGLRGTGESVAVNVGGRLIGASAAFITPLLAGMVPGPNPTAQLAYAMATVAAVALGAGCMMTFWMPEPRTADLPE
jgi:MFS family permease